MSERIIRNAGSPCVWCGEEMDHNCGAGACGNCCGDLGMIAHESPRGYKWLTEHVLIHLLRSQPAGKETK